MAKKNWPLTPDFTNSILLNKLCADGFIKAGEYYIIVCW